MEKHNNKTIRNMALSVTALILAMSATSCGKTENNNSDKKEAETTTTAVTTVSETAETTEKNSDTETMTSETAPITETNASDAPVVTTAPDDFDAQLDSMMSSIEAEIPDITVWSGLSNDSDPAVTPDDTGTATTTTVATTTMTTTSAPDTNMADLKNEQQLLFDGTFYDNDTFTSANTLFPAGWTKGASDRQYENAAYPGCYAINGVSKGVTFTIGDAKKNNKTVYPDLKLYKGLTWGATVADIKAAYGEPVKEGKTDQYTTILNDLYYHSANGGLIIFAVSEDWGLIQVNCTGIY